MNQRDLLVLANDYAKSFTKALEAYNISEDLSTSLAILDYVMYVLYSVPNEYYLEVIDTYGDLIAFYIQREVNTEKDLSFTERVLLSTSSKYWYLSNFGQNQ